MSAELYIECGNCGNELEIEKTVLQNNMRDLIIVVPPCPKCMRERGLKKGEKEECKNEKDVQ